jgi:hypothetical protein
MNKKVKTGLLLLAVAVTAVLALVWTTTEVEARGNRPGPIIYVVTQDLYYDSIVTADPLPPKGPFQELRAGGGPLGGNLNTDYGPGDPQYVGGRWVETFMTGEPHYFSCPLLGPGRESP